LKFYDGLAPLLEDDESLGMQMAEVLDSMSILQRELGQRGEAIHSLQQGIELLEACHEANSPATRERIGKMELSLAYTMGDSVLADSVENPVIEAQYRRALAELRGLERRWPERRQPYIICLRFLAERAFRRGDRDEAEGLWQEAITSGEAYLAQQPNDIDTRVSLCWACVERYNRLLRDPEKHLEAESVLQVALKHVNIAIKENSKSAQARDVAASIKLSLGTLRCRSGRVDEAVVLYQDAMNSIESLSTDFPFTSEYWISSKWFLDDITANLRDQGRKEDLGDILRQFAVWLEGIGPSVPADHEHQKLLSQSRRNLAKQFHEAGLPQEAAILATSRK
jgi:tetratricopeptide (TPR) repeat protein